MRNLLWLLCLCTAQVWCQSITGSTPMSVSTISSSTTTIRPTTAAPPSNVVQVNVLTRSETHLELQWTKVNNNNYYYILRDSNGTETTITGSDAETTVNHTVSSLSPGTNYSFTLFTVFEGVRSTGFNFSVVTTPSNVVQVNVLTRSETHLELQWTKVNNNNNYDYILRDSNGTETTITGSDAGTTVNHKVSSLSAGTNYSFTLFTVFEGVRSTGFNFSVVTTPSNVVQVNVLTRSENHLELQWTKVNNNNNYDYILRDGSGTETTITGSNAETTVNHTVSSLSAGTNYSFTLFTVFEGVRSTGLQFSDITTPAQVINLNCAPGDFSIRLKWEKPLGGVTGVEVNVNGKGSNSVSGTENVVTGLQPAQTYSISVTSVFGVMRSSPVEIKCQTGSTVIWVPVLVIILLGLAAVGVFVYRRKPKLLNKIHMPMYERHTETDSSQDKFKAISKQKFPDHFHRLSRDENRELTMEYMQFSSVGADLTQREATLAENKSKNRFIDILPYDCSRVKLSTHGHDSDYINANYIPGYGGKNMDYIAAQGPLPSTVSDFWRMIWEQKSERIIMVTNCVENEKTKCEQYWPQSNVSCRHGDLHITTKSERTDTNWTIREFLVKNEKAKSEVRFVKHFHFTAWPDHGVPAGTETLIQFRGLIRDHIIKSQTSGPTVVHCSAGVGRTGTLIALDVLLQQLEKEQAVDIAGFVYRMRRHRPRMVQTESQYIFLHQCIKDCLTEEPLYANVNPSSNLIYENTMDMGLK